MATMAKRTRGRQKIEMKRIEKYQARKVCLSKRRNGLFKKATELATLCGVDVCVVVISDSGKPYCFGDPSVDAVIDRFLGGREGCGEVYPADGAVVEGEVEGKKKRKMEEGLREKRWWWEADLDELGVDQLVEFERELEQLLANLVEYSRG